MKVRIYKIECHHTDYIGEFYVGSTKNELRFRFSAHRNASKNEKNLCMALYQLAVKIGWDNFRIILLEELDVNSYQERLQREQYYIELLKPSLNTNRAFSSQEVNENRKREYYAKNSERIKQNVKEYAENNKDAIKDRCKEYYSKNSERIKQKTKEYVEKNKEAVKAYKKEYYQLNYDKISAQKKQFREENHEKILEQKRLYYKNNKERIKTLARGYCDCCKKEYALYSLHLKTDKHKQTETKMFFEELPFSVEE